MKMRRVDSHPAQRNGFKRVIPKCMTSRADSQSFELATGLLDREGGDF